MIDCDALVKDKVLKVTLLKAIDIGAYGSVYHDSDTSRVCFIESLKNIIVHPYLHKNTNKFMGLKST